MPRQARINYPGTLNHIIARGIERRLIFVDDHDRVNFIARLGEIFKKTSTECYAWVLMPNHFHLLLVAGKRSLSHVMQSLLTGYAIYFNHRHRRMGHLFQNRYKSILCEKDTYFLELVRYIHLNPIRAKIVKDVEGLNRYVWSGHRVLMGRGEYNWQNCGEVLGMFSNNINDARAEYYQFVKDGINQGKRNDLIGGGLIRSLGGWSIAVQTKGDERQMGDERILGSGEFVEEVLKAVDEQEDQQSRLIRRGWDADKILNYVAHASGIEREEIIGNSKQRDIVKARILTCQLLIDDLGIKQIKVARMFNISKSAVNKNIEKGKKIIKEMKIELEKVEM